MTTRVLVVVFVLFSGFLLAACGDEASGDDPPEIEYGVDTCDRCNMIISEERYASGLVDEDGEQLVFDDTGEMVAFMQENPGTYDDWRVWVHDYETVEWLDGTEASYVHTMDVITPMSAGVLAFETREAAETFVNENSGTIMDWPTLLSDYEMPKMDGH